MPRTDPGPDPQRIELYSPEFFADPFAFYGRLREEDPVHWHAPSGQWIITRFEDVSRVIRQPVLFSSRLSALDTGVPDPPIRPEDLPRHEAVNRYRVEEFIQMDPPEHTDKRACVAPRFGRWAIEEVRPMIRDAIGSLLDEVAPDGHMDVLTAVARPLPLLVIASMMGVPPEEASLVAAQARKRLASVLSLAEDRLEIALEGFLETAEYVDGAVHDRLREASSGCPMRPDVLGDIAAAQARGQYSTLQSAANAMLLIDAGHETTIQLICNATLALLRRPDQWALLKGDPDRHVTGATEESLRYDPPLHAIRRVTTAEVEVGDTVIPAGARILGAIASANRDPRRFADPEVFNIERRPNTHLSFGAGAHYCLGQYLARVEGQEYLRALAERFPTARLSRPDSATYASTPRVRSVTSVPIVWS